MKKNKARPIFEGDKKLAFGLWRTADISKLGAYIKTSINKLVMEVPEETLQLCKLDVEVQFLLGIMGFSVSFDTTSSYSGVAYGKFDSFARLDAFMGTKSSRICADCSENVCGHCQRINRETLSLLPQIAFAQVTKHIGANNKDWYPVDLTVF